MYYFYFQKRKDPENDIEITELRNRGIRILTQMGPCPPELTGLTHGSVLSFPEVEAKLVPSSAAHLCPHHTSIMFSAPFVLTHSPFLPVGSLSSVHSSSLGWHLCLGASSPQRLPASVADICFLAHCFGLPVGMGHTRTSKQRTMVSPLWDFPELSPREQD